jgi:hypothetical protein
MAVYSGRCRLFFVLELDASFYFSFFDLDIATGTLVFNIYTLCK